MVEGLAVLVCLGWRGGSRADMGEGVDRGGGSLVVTDSLIVLTLLKALTELLVTSDEGKSLSLLKRSWRRVSLMQSIYWCKV